MNNFSKNALVQYFKDSEKETSNLKIGLEHEIVGFFKESKKRITYENGIKPILEGFQKLDDWSPKFEAGKVIALEKDCSSITIEPGGQLELSIKPLKYIREIDAVLRTHQKHLKEICSHLGIQFFSVGYDPVSTLDEIPWMPKKRYRIMKEYLPQFGDRVHHMMLASCSVQANFDYTSEDDMRKKFLIANGLSPIINIAFASSPLVQSKNSGLKSKRTWAWRGMDPARTGLIKAAFNDNFSYEDYVDYIMDVPMLVLEREGKVIDYSGKDFKKYFFDGNNIQDFADWKDQLGATFPVARLKNALEVRSVDAGSYDMVMAMAAFWKGLFYNPESLAKAVDFVKYLGLGVIEEIHSEGFEKGYSLITSKGSIHELIKELVSISYEGLISLESIDGCSSESMDSSYFSSLQSKVNIGLSEADLVLEETGGNPKNEVFSILEKKGLSFT